MTVSVCLNGTSSLSTTVYQGSGSMEEESERTSEPEDGEACSEMLCPGYGTANFLMAEQSHGHCCCLHQNYIR